MEKKFNHSIIVLILIIILIILLIIIIKDSFHVIEEKKWFIAKKTNDGKLEFCLSYLIFFGYVTRGSGS